MESEQQRQLRAIVQQLLNRPHKERQTLLHICEHLPVQHHDAHQICESIDRPESQHVGFCGADTAAESQACIKTGIQYMDNGFESVAAKSKRLIPLYDGNFSNLKQLELSKYPFPRQLVKTCSKAGINTA